MRIPSALFGFLAAAICPLALSAASISDFVQINLVSSVPGMAPKTDPGLINPWGISFGGATPFWISDNGAGTATLYNGSGDKQGLIVTLPSFVPGGTISPTGTVFNGGTAFNSDLFIFASEDGFIDGWRGALGTTGEILFATPGANYKGLAIGSVGGNAYLYAADFANGQVTVFPSMGAPPLAGNFTKKELSLVT